MSADGNRLDALLIALLDNPVQCISNAVVEVVNALTVGAGLDHNLVPLVEAREQLLQE